MYSETESESRQTEFRDREQVVLPIPGTFQLQTGPRITQELPSRPVTRWDKLTRKAKIRLNPTGSLTTPALQLRTFRRPMEPIGDGTHRGSNRRAVAHGDPGYVRRTVRLGNDRREWRGSVPGFAKVGGKVETSVGAKVGAKNGQAEGQKSGSSSSYGEHLHESDLKTTAYCSVTTEGQESPFREPRGGPRPRSTTPHPDRSQQ